MRTHEELADLAARAHVLDRRAWWTLVRRWSFPRPSGRRINGTRGHLVAELHDLVRQLPPKDPDVLAAAGWLAQADQLYWELALEGEDLAARAARRTARRLREDEADLMQEARLGLRQAAERWDHKRGIPYCGYAALWIRSSIRAWVMRTRGPCRISARALSELAHQADRPADTRRSHDLQLAVAWMAAERLDAPVGASQRPMHELLADQSGGGDVDLLLDVARIPSAVGLLSDRQQEVLRRRYHEEQTFQEIGQAMGCSGAWAHQLHKKALTELRLEVSP